MSGIILMVSFMLIGLGWTIYNFYILIKNFFLMDLIERISYIIISFCGISYTAIFFHDLITLVKGVM